MAETIGSLKYSIEFEDINTKSVTDKVTEQINKTADAAESLGDVIDDVTKQLEETAADTAAAVTQTTAAVSEGVTAVNAAIDNIDATGLANGVREINEQFTETANATEQHAAAVVSLSSRIKEVKERMADLVVQGKQESEEYSVLLKQLGELMDIRGDIQAQGTIFANDNADLQAINAGVGTYQKSLGLLGDTIGAVAGKENDVTAAAAAFNNVQAAGNTIQGISNALNKDGYIRRVLLTKITAAQTAVQNGLTSALGGSAVAANVAKVAMYGLSAAVAAATLGLPFLIIAIEKAIDKWRAHKKMMQDMAESVGDEVGETIGKIRQLQSAYAELGNDMQKKAEFVRDNKSAFDDLGVSIDNINDAENLLVKNTDIYVAAIMARAKANAAQSQLNDKYTDLITERASKEQELAELEERIKANEQRAQHYRDLSQSQGRTAYLQQQDALNEAQALDAANKLRRQMAEIREQIKADEDEFNRENVGLVKLVQQSQAEAAANLAASGVREKAKNGGTQSGKTTKEQIQEELTEYELMKQALKDYQDLRNKGVDPTTFKIEEENLKKQIKAYEERNHLVEKPKKDYTDQIARYKEFSEKLVAITRQAQDKAEEIRNGDGTADEKRSAISNIFKFRDADIEMLKNEYGIIGDNLAEAVLDGIAENIAEGQMDIANKIVALRDNIANLAAAKDANGNQINNAEQIAVLQGQLTDLTRQYDKLREKATKAGEESKAAADEKKLKAYERAKTAVNSLAKAFGDMGEQIGGSIGKALQATSTLTAGVMDTIDNIKQFSELATKEIEGVSKATATAIKAVESASVVLAVISTAMQVAQKLIDMFDKSADTYEKKKNAYDTYISTLDKVISKEKELTAALDAQNAAVSYDAIGEKIKQQENATRQMLDVYNNGKGNAKMLALSAMYQKNKEELNKQLGEDLINGLTNDAGVFDARLITNLSQQQLIKLRSTSIYTALDDEQREYIDKIIDYADQAADNIKEEMAQINAISFDEFSNNFLSALQSMDSSAADIAADISDQMRKALISDMFKKDYADKLQDYYNQWYAAMENDGAIDANEMAALNTLKESIVNGATAAAKQINDMFADSTATDEQSLSGAIKGASQESIDLLAGQTNAVRMNQIEGLEIARQQLAAVLSIDKNVKICADALADIKNEVSGGKSLRSQGLEY